MHNINPLTEKQKQVLKFIEQYRSENDVAPTLKEIASFLGTANISTAQYYVEQIRSKGHLIKATHASRGLITVPLLGKIAAGAPIEAIESNETIEVPSTMNLKPSSSYYALEVCGDSMIDMGILDGDIVLIQNQFTANIGDVVVAVIEGNATLKVYKRKNGKIILEAKNPTFKPIVCDEVEIRGKFIGLIRVN